MTILRLLIDVNVILDFILARQPFAAEAKRIFQANDKGRIEGYIAASSIPNVFYFVRRDLKATLGEVQATKEAYKATKLCIDSFGIVALDEPMIRSAMLQPGNDLEDQLQATAVLAAGLDAIVTRDKDFRWANVKSLTPNKLLKQI